MTGSVGCVQLSITGRECACKVHMKSNEKSTQINRPYDCAIIFLLVNDRSYAGGGVQRTEEEYMHTRMHVCTHSAQHLFTYHYAMADDKGSLQCNCTPLI